MLIMSRYDISTYVKNSCMMIDDLAPSTSATFSSQIGPREVLHQAFPAENIWNKMWLFNI